MENSKIFLVLAGACIICASLIIYIANVNHAEREDSSGIMTRRISFSSVYLELTSDSPNKSCFHSDEVQGWRIQVACTSCAISVNDLPTGEVASWESLKGSQFEKCGIPYLARASDFSAVMLAVRGPGTALTMGFARIPEFPPSLILFIEANERNVNWMCPEDFDLAELGMNIGKRPGSEFGNGFHICFADGDVWYVSANIPHHLLTQLCTVDGAMQADRSHVLGEFVLRKNNGPLISHGMQ